MGQLALIALQLIVLIVISVSHFQLVAQFTLQSLNWACTFIDNIDRVPRVNKINE